MEFTCVVLVILNFGVRDLLGSWIRIMGCVRFWAMMEQREITYSVLLLHVLPWNPSSHSFISLPEILSSLHSQVPREATHVSSFSISEYTVLKKKFYGIYREKEKNNSYYFPNLKMVVVFSATKWADIYFLIQACIFNKIAYKRNCIYFVSIIWRI